MKFMLNGALTIVTLDGANVEMYELLGDENMFLFGLHTDEIAKMRAQGYDPNALANANPELMRIFNRFSQGFSDGKSYSDLVSMLLYGGDQYMLIADYRAYADCQSRMYQTIRDESELGRLAGLEDTLRARVIGQEEAVTAVAAAIRRSRVQISPRRRPASFIFVGSTGVGKTELVKVLAAQLFDTPETLIRLDMSEFMEKHAVSRLIGSPPGYVGYDEAGQLTEKVRRKPYSVILFDEIEKAHPDVLNILLQILDEGRVTDAHGRVVNFENTVIVMTSNAGSQFKENLMGFGQSTGEAAKEQAMKALRDFLRPEFIGRVDEVVFFRPLALEDFVTIARLMLEELVSPLAERGIALSWTDGALEALAKAAHGGKRGTRDLRNVIRRQVENDIAQYIVVHHDTPPTAITVEAGDNDVTLVYR